MGEVTNYSVEFARSDIAFVYNDVEVSQLVRSY